MSNDTIILGTIFFFFVITGFLVSLDTSTSMSSTVDTTKVEGDALNDTVTGDVGLVTGWTYLKTIAGMFFWSFGAIPFWLEIVLFVPLRMVSLLLLYRLIRSGSG